MSASSTSLPSGQTGAVASGATFTVNLAGGGTAKAVNTVCMCPACMAARAAAAAAEQRQDGLDAAATSHVAANGLAATGIVGSDATAAGTAGTAAGAASTAAATTPNISAMSLAQQQFAAISFENGLASTGTLNAKNFWNWNGNEPATYGFDGHAEGSAFKAGSGTVGTPGTISYFFDPGSNWTPAEQAGIKAAMQVWSDECGVTFTQASSAASADETFYRAGSTTPGNPAVSGEAFTAPGAYVGTVGSSTAGNLAPGGYTAIDTSAFGDVDSFNTLGGYGIDTIVHEIGHALGLGHTGAYNGAVDAATEQNGVYDSRLYSVMSYIDPGDTSAEYYGQYALYANWGTSADGYLRVESTPMVDDVIAAQQLYGAPSSGGLMGGQIFGFDCNITDGTQEMFDFTIDQNPVVTLYDAGGGNTLDLSGFASGSTVNLNGGTYSSADGLTDDIGIAYGTRIDGFVGGAGNDTITLNDDADRIDGGGGGNVVVVAGDQAQYTISYVGNGEASLIGDGQSAELTDIQTIRFADGSTVSVPTSTAQVWAGGNGSFGTASGWQDGIVPSSTSDVTIATASTVTVGASAAVGSLQLGGSATLDLAAPFTVVGDGTGSIISGIVAVAPGGSLTLGGSVAGTGSLNLGTGTLVLSGAKIGASLRVTAGTLSGTGEFDASLAGIAAVTAESGGTLTLGGLAGGDLEIGGGSTLALEAGVANGTSLSFLDAASTVDLAAGAPMMAAVTGFAAGDAVDFEGEADATLAAANGVVTVSDAQGHTLATLTMANASTLQLAGQSDGHGGTELVAQAGTSGTVAEPTQPTSTGSTGTSTPASLPAITVQTAAPAASGQLQVAPAETYTVAASHDQVSLGVADGGITFTDGGQSSSGALASVGVTAVQFTDGTAIVDQSGTASDVARLYQAAFGRTADASGLEYWTAQIDQGSVGLYDVANGFLGTPEGQTLATESASAFVSQVYASALGRAPDAGGLASWTSAIDSGALSRGEVMTQIAESGEAQVGTMNVDGSVAASEIERLYQTVLGRAPDSAGQVYWTEQLQAGQTPAQLAQAMTGSAEFTADALSTTEFVTQLYANGLGRSPDASGLQYWVGQIDSGAVTQAQAAASFAGSPEAVSLSAGTHQGWVWLANS